jgi:hypothetical protein
MPIVLGGLLVAIAIGIIAYAYVHQNPSPNVGSIKCDLLEQTQVHYHAAVQIEYVGNPISIPTDIGRPPTGCLYWLHMHAESPGVIHIESPANQTYTLGDFFDVWAKSKGTPEPLDSTHVSTFTLTKDQQLIVLVDLSDSKGPTRYSGNPRSIVLKAHEVITLEIAPPVVDPPPSFTFPSGL